MRGGLINDIMRYDEEILDLHEKCIYLRRHVKVVNSTKISIWNFHSPRIFSITTSKTLPPIQEADNFKRLAFDEIFIFFLSQYFKPAVWNAYLQLHHVITSKFFLLLQRGDWQKQQNHEPSIFRKRIRRKNSS